MDIEDRAGRFHRVANCLGAGGKTFVNEFLIFVHQSLELTLWGGDAVEFFDVEETQPLNIYRSTILDTPKPVRSIHQCVNKTYLVGLVVKLRVILINFGLLLEVEVPKRLSKSKARHKVLRRNYSLHNLIHAKILSPLFGA